MGEKPPRAAKPGLPCGGTALAGCAARVILLILLVGGPTLAAPPGDSYADRVARTYYAVPRTESPEWSGTLSGLVVDRRGRGIPGAQVVVESTSKVVGRAVTDEAGRFRIPRVPKRANEVTVTADGFVRWAIIGQNAAEGVTLPLDREVDDAFLSALPAMEDPEERLWGVLELAGARQIGLEMGLVHPHIGGLRQDLRLVAGSASFAATDDRDSPANRARRLLAWWADPADADLTSSWLLANEGVGPPPKPVTTATLDQLCTQWADRYFEAEGVPPGRRTAHGCFEPRSSADGSRTYLTFWVRYAHWGHEIHLVAINKGDWELALVGPGLIDHFDP